MKRSEFKKLIKEELENLNQEEDSNYMEDDPEAMDMLQDYGLDQSVLDADRIVEQWQRTHLKEGRTENRKVAVVQIEHKPTKTIFYSYTAYPAEYLQHVMTYRKSEKAKEGSDTLSQLLRQDTETKNYTLDVVDVVDSMEQARDLAKKYNKQAGVKYKLGRKAKDQQVEVIVLDKNDSKQLNDLFVIKKTALTDPKYKEVKVDKTRAYTMDGNTYYAVLNLNVERK
jgi:hypothetical protein